MTDKDRNDIPDESNLSPKQRQWLEESKKIGPGTMTKSERERLEKIYAEMLPAEQQELQKFIHKHYHVEIDETPIKEREQREWSEPSKKLKSVLSSSQVKTPPLSDDDES